MNVIAKLGDRRADDEATAAAAVSTSPTPTVIGAYSVVENFISNLFAVARENDARLFDTIGRALNERNIEIVDAPSTPTAAAIGASGRRSSASSSSPAATAERNETSAAGDERELEREVRRAGRELVERFLV